MIGFGPGSDGWVGASYLLGDGGGGEVFYSKDWERQGSMKIRGMFLDQGVNMLGQNRGFL